MDNSSWQCPNCGERVDPEFAVCWNCGTGRDGTPAADFQPEADDPTVPDPGPDGEEPAAPEADLGPANERIVELCSAANIVEAEDICIVLADEDIPARVVGNLLGNAAGCLPLGETTAPRVWVRQSDAARAREVLVRRLAEQKSNAADVGQIANLSYERPEWEEAEQEEEPLPSDVRFRFLSQGFYIIGAICVLAGIFWAWHNRLILAEYPATADGRWIGNTFVGVEGISVPGDDNLPIPRVREAIDIFRPEYVYIVDGKRYQALGEVAAISPGRVLIRYKPDRPYEHVVGPIAPPGLILVFAVVIGSFLMFVGFKFR